MQDAQPRFEAAGAGLVLIGQATPRQAAHFRRRLGIELPVLADEQRASYKAIGTKVAGIGGLLSPKLVAKGLATAASSHVVQGRTVGHPGQLGAALVIAPGDRVLLSHIARDAGDNVAPEALLGVLGLAVETAAAE